MKILITGGHFSPAHSIIQKLNNDDIMVVGRRYAFEGDKNETLEYHICKQLDIPFREIHAGRLQRKISVNTLPSVLRFPRGVIEALGILRDFKPDVVVTFGGYVGLPVALAAKMLGIPVVLHEQTQKAGISSKIISKFASAVCISFESSRKFFKNKNIVLTGNPVRKVFLSPIKESSIKVRNPLIYITGGSTGSHAINAIVEEIVPELIKDFAIVHQVGDSQEFRDFDRLDSLQKSLPKALSDNYFVRKFVSVEDVAFLFQNADVVISRSGINTVLELIACKSRAILIPLPYGQRNEQDENADLFVKIGGGIKILQKELTASSLKEAIRDMMVSKEQFQIQDAQVSEFIFPDSSERIIDVIQKYSCGKKENGTGDIQQADKSV